MVKLVICRPGQYYEENVSANGIKQFFSSEMDTGHLVSIHRGYRAQIS